MLTQSLWILSHLFLLFLRFLLTIPEPLALGLHTTALKDYKDIIRSRSYRSRKKQVNLYIGLLNIN